MKRKYWRLKQSIFSREARRKCPFLGCRTHFSYSESLRKHHEKVHGSRLEEGPEEVIESTITESDAEDIEID